MKIPLTDIVIGERQRLDLGDLSDLSSMSDPLVGQIVPIIVHKKNNQFELVEGRRRIAKATQLGWTHIDAYEKDTLTPVQKELCELFADIGRKDRTWQEKCLATAKINTMLRLEKASIGETWTLSAMSSFTGQDRSSLGYMLQVATALRVEPPDLEIWSASGYVPALQILVGRNLHRANDELERRRAKQMFPPSEVRESDPTGKVDAPVVEELSTTVRIFGNPTHIETYPAVLAYQPTIEQLPSICSALAPNGYAVVWLDTVATALHWKNSVSEHGFKLLPFLLVWDKIQEPESRWPFYANYEIGIVLTHIDNEPTELFANPQKANVSAIQSEAGLLPIPVVAMSLRTIAHEGQQVFLPCNANPVAVAVCGQVPVWLEPDQAKYEAKLASLRQYYLTTIPGAVFE